MVVTNSVSRFVLVAAGVLAVLPACGKDDGNRAGLYAFEGDVGKRVLVISATDDRTVDQGIELATQTLERQGIAYDQFVATRQGEIPENQQMRLQDDSGAPRYSGIVLTNDKVSGLITAQDLARRTFALVRQNIGIVGVPNLSALVIGTFIPVSPIAAVLLNNGSCLVAAGNAMRTLAFTPAPLPSVAPASQPTATPDASGNAPAKTSANATEKTNTPGDAKAPTTLTAKALATRLGTTHQTLTARRRRGDLANWSRSLDPEGLSWSHVSGDGTYVALLA